MTALYKKLPVIIFAFFAMFTQFEHCQGASIVGPTEHDGPWFTGPLLTPSARVIPKGHFNLEPYQFCFFSDSLYDNNWKATSVPSSTRLVTQLQAKFGIWEKLDISFSPQSHMTFTPGGGGAAFGDLPIGFGYQLYEGKPKDLLTYIKLSVTEVFPTGKYHGLDPEDELGDTSGQGSYLTNLSLTFSKLVKLPNHLFFSWRCNFTASIPSSARIRGLSIYGGNENTRIKAFPGTSFFFFAGAEYTLIKQMSLACDFEARYSPKTHFRGFSEVPLFGGEVLHFGLAPAIEYNFDENTGLIVGSWFSLAGRNASRFVSAVAAFNYSY